MTTDETMTPTATEEAKASDTTVMAPPLPDDLLNEPEEALSTPSYEEPEPPAQEAAVETAVQVDPPQDALSTPAPEPRVQQAPIEAAVQVAAPVEPRRSKKEDDMMLFEAAMNAMEGGGGDADDGTFKKLNKGDRVEATVIQVDKDRVFVDLGTKSEGIVPLSELSEENLETAHGQIQVGDKINVVVIKAEGGDGNPIVSKRRADFEASWDRIEDALRTGEMITAQVIDRVKGGLVVDVGVRGFVPATHVGNGKLRNIEKYVGQPLDLKVIEIDRERKKVVLSNREAEELRRAKAKDEIFEKVAPGEILDGTVRRLTDYGAFVDLGGVDGLLHISEMSWARINHPREMFKEGQKIKVMVLRLDAGAGKISLGHRQVLPDPWNLIKENYKVQQTMKVTIGRLVQSGAFIKLPEGAEAFLPVSEMSFRRIKRPQDVVEENQEVEVQIIDLRTDERRMVLSMRASGTADRGEAGVGYTRREPSAPPAFDDDMRGGDKRGKKKARKGVRGGRDVEDDFEESVGRRGYATGGATIGERLGMLKGLLGRDDDLDEDETAAEVDPDAEVVAGAETEGEAEAVAPVEQKTEDSEES